MKKKQRIVGRIHNSGEYVLDPKYSHQSVSDQSDVPGNLPNNPIENPSEETPLNQ